MKQIEHVTHENIPPVYNEKSKILILGSMPSKKSREASFYYMHPQNRFWPILESLFQETITDKKEFVLRKKIALWDTISSCDILGASDASIKNVIPNDIPSLIRKTNIKVIFTAGKTADKYYQKFVYPKTQIKSILLPSTSPANAKKTLEDLIKEWSIILKFLEEGSENESNK